MIKLKGGRKVASGLEGASDGIWHQPAVMNLLADVLIIVALSVFAWMGWAALHRLPVFPLREVTLSVPPQQVSVEQVEHVARSVITGNFFTVDLDRTRLAFEKLPWVRKASVRRIWPDGLSLQLEEHEAVAHWRYPNGEQGLVNRQGEVFVADLPESSLLLPRLAGPEGSTAEILARHGEFSLLLSGIGRGVESITLSARRAWQLRLDNGVAVELGRDQVRHPLSERLKRFVAHYDLVRQRVGFSVADMRYPSGFVLSGIDGNRVARRELVGRRP